MSGHGGPKIPYLSAEEIEKLSPQEYTAYIEQITGATNENFAAFASLYAVQRVRGEIDLHIRMREAYKEINNPIDPEKLFDPAYRQRIEENVALVKHGDRYKLKEGKSEYKDVLEKSDKAIATVKSHEDLRIKFTARTAREYIPHLTTAYNLDKKQIEAISKAADAKIKSGANVSMQDTLREEAERILIAKRESQDGWHKTNDLKLEIENQMKAEGFSLEKDEQQYKREFHERKIKAYGLDAQRDKFNQASTVTRVKEDTFKNKLYIRSMERVHADLGLIESAVTTQPQPATPKPTYEPPQAVKNAQEEARKLNLSMDMLKERMSGQTPKPPSAIIPEGTLRTHIPSIPASQTPAPLTPPAFFKFLPSSLGTRLSSMIGPMGSLATGTSQVAGSLLKTLASRISTALKFIPIPALQGILRGAGVALQALKAFGIDVAGGARVVGFAVIGVIILIILLPVIVGNTGDWTPYYGDENLQLSRGVSEKNLGWNDFSKQYLTQRSSTIDENERRWKQFEITYFLPQDEYLTLRPKKITQ